MTMNKLTDLNDHLFMEIERLGDEDLTDEELEKEVKRAKALSSVAGRVINNAALVLDARKYVNSMYNPDEEDKIPKMLE